jgi:hypothetical protein
MSPDLRIAFARALLWSEESAAAYQIEVSTNWLMSRALSDAEVFWRLPKSPLDIDELLKIRTGKLPGNQALQALLDDRAGSL